MWVNYKKKNSGIHSYEIDEHSIRIRFHPDINEVYTYNYAIPGMTEVERMKDLAVANKGLSTYISQEIREHYFSKNKLRR